jgi:hypothetical protein
MHSSGHDEAPPPEQIAPLQVTDLVQQHATQLLLRELRLPSGRQQNRRLEDSTEGGASQLIRLPEMGFRRQIDRSRERGGDPLLILDFRSPPHQPRRSKGSATERRL